MMKNREVKYVVQFSKEENPALYDIYDVGCEVIHYVIHTLGFVPTIEIIKDGHAVYTRTMNYVRGAIDGSSIS